MLQRLSFKLVSLLVAAGVAGCATSDIVPMGTDTYMIAQTSAGGIFKAMSSLKTEVIQRANQFAESKGKVAVPVASKETPARPGRNMPSFEYQFRLVDKDDPRASGAALVPRADIVVENKTVVAGGAKPAQGKDVYAELIKLDDLKKRGIISEDEFQTQKTRLLNAN